MALLLAHRATMQEGQRPSQCTPTLPIPGVTEERGGIGGESQSARGEPWAGRGATAVNLNSCCQPGTHFPYFHCGKEVEIWCRFAAILWTLPALWTAQSRYATPGAEPAI